MGAAGGAADAGEGTDFHAVANGFVSVTPLQIDLHPHRPDRAGLRLVAAVNVRASDLGQASRARAHGRAVARPGHPRRARAGSNAGSALATPSRDEGLAFSAYDDTPLPIGFQQTISQPFVVARMLELLRSGREPGRTLEVGAGCGYQAAVLSLLATEVYAVERIRGLPDRARANPRPLRLPNVRLKLCRR